MSTDHKDRRRSGKRSITGRPIRPDREAWTQDRPLDGEDTSPPDRVLPDPVTWGHTPETARAELERQMCPVCGEGPWKSPLNHVARKHGIGRLEMRDACHLSTTASVTDSELHERFRERSQELDLTRLQAAAAQVDRRKARRTNASRAAIAEAEARLSDWAESNPDEMARLRAEFRDRMTTPEALERWNASMERVRAGRQWTPKERAEFAKRMADPDVVAKREAYNDDRRIDTCSVNNCSKPHLARGYCKAHYWKWRKYGDPFGKGRVGGPRALTDDQAEQALRMLAAGSSQRRVAEHFGCSQTAIGRLARGELKDQE